MATTEAEWFVAQDTFCAELPGGAQQTVQKGSTWHKSEHVVKLDAGRNVLFLPQRSGQAEEPAKAPRPRSRASKSAPAADDTAPSGTWEAPADDGGDA